MNKHSGTLDFEYNGRRLAIPYSYAEYGGNAHIHIKNKNNGWHGFFYRTTTKQWLAEGREPKWPKDFIYSLHRMFDMVLEEVQAG